MSHSPHQLLSDMFKQQRDTESQALQQLTRYRQKLNQIIKQSSVQLRVLQQQRDKKIERGAQASELILIEQSLHEHQQHIQDVTQEIAALDMAIKQQKAKWVHKHKKFKSHEKLHNQLQHKAKRLMAQKLQIMQDDQFAATLGKQHQVSL